MALSQAQFLASEKVHRIFLFEIAAVKHIVKKSECTAGSTGGNDWYSTPWPPDSTRWYDWPNYKATGTGGSVAPRRLVIKPTAVKHGTDPTISPATLTNVDTGNRTNDLNTVKTTNSRWYYDDFDPDAPVLYINPDTGASYPSDWFVVEYTLYLATEGYAATVGGRDRTFIGGVVEAPIFERAVALPPNDDLESSIGSGVGSLRIVAHGWLALRDRLEKDIFYNCRVTIRQVGYIRENEGAYDSSSEWLSYANAVTMGVARIGDTCVYDGRSGIAELSLRDDIATLTDTFQSAGPIGGQIAEVVQHYLPSVEFDPTPKTSFNTARPYSCAMILGERVSAIDILSAFCRYLVSLFTKRNGTYKLVTWDDPDSSSSVTIPEEVCSEIRVSVDWSNVYSTVEGTLASMTGPRGTINTKKRAKLHDSPSDKNVERKRTAYTSGWTNHPNASNTWYRVFERRVVGVQYKQGDNDYNMLQVKTVNDCDTDDETWTQIVADDQAATGYTTAPATHWLFINPPGSQNPNDDDVVVYWELERDNTAVTATNGRDRTFYSTSAGVAGNYYKDAIALYHGKSRKLNIQTIITNYSHLTSFIDALKDFVQFAKELVELTCPIFYSQSVELHDTVTLRKRLGAADQFSSDETEDKFYKVLGIREDYRSGLATLTLWRQHIGSTQAYTA